MYFGHGEDIHGTTLHKLVRNRRTLGFSHEISIVRVPGLTDRTTLLAPLDGIVDADLIDLDPALHVKGLFLNSWVHHVVVPSLIKLKLPGLRF